MDQWLIVAARKGDADELRSLLEEDANAIHERDRSGATALHAAAYSGHLECVRVLLEHGADVDATYNFKETPLHLASKEGHATCVRLLSEKGASVYAEDRWGDTPLHLASRYGRTSALQELLLAPDCDSVNVGDHDGDSPLHDAASRGHTRCITLLRMKGANVDLKNKLGKSPMEVAVDREAISLLRASAPASDLTADRVPYPRPKDLVNRNRVAVEQDSGSMGVGFAVDTVDGANGMDDIEDESEDGYSDDQLCTDDSLPSSPMTQRPATMSQLMMAVSTRPPAQLMAGFGEDQDFDDDDDDYGNDSLNNAVTPRRDERSQDSENDNEDEGEVFGESLTIRFEKSYYDEGNTDATNANDSYAVVYETCVAGKPMRLRTHVFSNSQLRKFMRQVKSLGAAKCDPDVADDSVRSIADLLLCDEE
eukprot:TRINITY_DN4017_c0_g1_i1.p1 TRINITY_DN4017_c0_g1~~TRINITY_DN4017_c0_g1_i1.p1  ORF type:complete len:423 (-),score=86.38 TRINITY_DN4017_c0_g1_i1:104-1372(-)